MLSLPDRRLDGRTKRLAAVSAVALGVIYWQATVSPYGGALPEAALLLGWLLMPAVLIASLLLPAARLALLLPSTLVTAGLAIVGWQALGDSASAAAGWLLLGAGILLGDLLGAWLWFGLLPVPLALREPGARLRWLAIGVHVALVLGGLAYVIMEA